MVTRVTSASSLNGAHGLPGKGKSATMQPRAKRKPLDEALNKLRAAQDEALAAAGITPLSPVRKFVNLLGSLAVSGGAYYLVMQITEIIVVAATAYFGMGFIAFMAAFIGLCLALFACWQTYAVTRSTLDAIAMGTVTPAELVTGAWGKVTGFFARSAVPA